ncbi:hypothetical protein, partial [Vibrio cholerae]|uniref:hypothetical protein n=1 Tax=Vibrio cholerae TaxID=666 RepID=UPI001964E7CA
FQIEVSDLVGTNTAKESGLLEWAEDVLSKIEFIKFSKMTNRTKIIHAFSALSRETLSFLLEERT